MSQTEPVAELNESFSQPGVSAPPPFGGSARTIVVTVDPQRLQSYGMSPDEVFGPVDRYCKAHPQSPVSDATEAMTREIIARRR